MTYPLIKKLGLKVWPDLVVTEEHMTVTSGSGAGGAGGFGHRGHTQRIYNVRASDIEALLAKAVRVSNEGLCKVWKQDLPPHSNDTHTALLIGIEEIKRDTAESLLRELIEANGPKDYPGSIIERAKALLEREGK